jgi:hypothetical protein
MLHSSVKKVIRQLLGDFNARTGGRFNLQYKRWCNFVSVHPKRQKAIIVPKSMILSRGYYTVIISFARKECYILH